ncbi:MAG: hypothetical protein VX709_01815 [Pseudomonadota bacterium]|nr:hypothetical protein [Pseudomonadota bacterium]
MITKLLIGQISLFTLDQIFPMVRDDPRWLLCDRPVLSDSGRA